MRPGKGGDFTLPANKQGLLFWMRRVLAEWRRVERDFAAEAVHDLRVALRRCRSLADGLMTVDSDPAWLAMKRAGRRLFRRLGELRDTQVMLEWTRKLAQPTDPAGTALTTLLTERESLLKAKAEKALDRFDRVQWKAWTKHLAGRAQQVALEGPVFQHLALARWQQAHALHQRAVRNRSRIAWHALRIGVKRFRYTVENFLPQRHEAWGADLKHIQDLLGEVHDLDVLWTTLPLAGSLFDDAARERWRDVIERERASRLAAYRQKMCGRNSQWHAWREELPAAEALSEAAFSTMECWAEFRDPDFSHTRHVTHLALNLFDELGKVRMAGPYGNGARRWLRAAALLHNVGRADGRRGHHKASYRLIREMNPPLGWTAEDFELVAIIARYHRGAEPGEQHLPFASLPAERQELVLHLGGLLRLAAAFDAAHDGRVRRLRVEGQPEMLMIWAQGYRDDEEHARILAAERHLLERALKRSILIRSHPGGPRRMPLTMDRRTQVA
jgi:exopolyphosphatase/guanosine-5'-triphosphate,3'-diphosphate pyrophosphatase